MSQPEVISIAALVISGLIGALWLMWREKVATLEKRWEESAEDRRRLNEKIARLESQHSQVNEDIQRVEKTLEQLMTRVEELTKIATRLEERMRRFTPPEFRYAQDLSRGQGER